MDTAGAILTIDLGAIRRNYRTLKAELGQAELAAVVKADAYGLGVEPVAQALYGIGCRTFFVATVAEGVRLRAALPDGDIHVFNGVQAGEEAELTAHRLVPVLNSLHQIALWRAHCRAANAPLRADLHLDTGMSRLGLDETERAKLEADLALLDGIDIDAVMSHLAVAEEAERPMNEAQRAAFDTASAHLAARRRSLASSFGIYLGAQYHFDLARAGVALYGANPTPGGPNPMAQVVRLQGRILQVRSVDTSRTVGYGATHRACRPSKIATVAIGYADGYPLSLSNVGSVFIDEHEVPVVGRVSMDLTTLDVTDLPDGLAEPGRLVDFIGPNNPVDDVARRAATISYQVLTGLSRRCRRVYAGADGHIA